MDFYQHSGISTKIRNLDNTKISERCRAVNKYYIMGPCIFLLIPHPVDSTPLDAEIQILGQRKI